MQLSQQRMQRGVSPRSGRPITCSSSFVPRRTSHRSLIRVPDISTAAVAEVATGPVYKHILVAIMDPAPFLGEGSKQATSAAALLAGPNESKVTLLVINEPGTTTPDPAKQDETLAWQMKDKGCTKYEIMRKETAQPASVLVGDTADSVEADLVVVSSEAIHAKHVCANQLAEFVSCPLYLVP